MMQVAVDKTVLITACNILIEVNCQIEVFDIKVNIDILNNVNYK